MTTYHAPAKINLNLNITGRQDNGYHTLDSTMVFTNWGDDITITQSPTLMFTVDGPYAHIFDDALLSTKRESKNLIIRAMWLMADRANITEPQIHIHLVKSIPSGAGLGGGSSDAACVMRALNEMWNLNLSMDDLCAMGLTLGAELPICLHAKPARVTGIGDIITPVEIAPLNMLIIWPDESLLTKDVFDAYRASNLPFTTGGDDWKQSGNDLTGAAIQLCPKIAEILSDLIDCDGCTLARMSGSGSACFGIFNTIEAAKVAKDKFKNAVVTTIF